MLAINEVKTMQSSHALEGHFLVTNGGQDYSEKSHGGKLLGNLEC